MPRFLVTRGLGGSASDLISMGFIDHVRAVFKGGKRFAKKAIADLELNFKISAALLSINGKELTKPIINTVTRLFSDSEDYALSVTPKKLIARKSNDINVEAKLAHGEKDESN